MNSGLEMVETKHVSGANVSRAEEKTLLNSFIVQACQKVIKVGGAIALEPEKVLGAKRRAMYLNLETLGGL